MYRYLNGQLNHIRSSTVKAIAQYLNVTTDYLMGTSDSIENYQEAQAPSINITDDEKVLLDLFRNIPAERQQEAIEHLAVYAIRLALKRDQ